MRQRVKFYMNLKLELALVSRHTTGVFGPNSKKLWLIKQTNKRKKLAFILLNAILTKIFMRRIYGTPLKPQHNHIRDRETFLLRALSRNNTIQGDRIFILFLNSRMSVRTF